MSTVLMGLCWPLQMSPTLKAVLVALADQANDQGYCWPSVGTICERTCLSERAVRNAVRGLESMGLVRVDIGAMKSNRYILLVRAYLAAQEALKRAAEAQAPAAVSDAAQGLETAEILPRAEEVSGDSRGHHVPGGTTCRGAPRAGEGGTTCPLTIIEPIHTPLTPQGGHATPSELQGSGSALGSGSGSKLDARGCSKNPIGLSTWLLLCREIGRKPVPEGAAVFAYCDAVGISRELLALCWREFKRRYEADDTRQKDWGKKFQRCVEGGWYRLWYLKPGEPAQLSSQGEQAQRFFAAADERAEEAEAADHHEHGEPHP